MQRVPVAPRPAAALRRAGDSAFDQYLSDIQHLPLITDIEEERRLARRARRGDPDAAEQLVTANLRFVISYVKRYQGRGLELADLVAIGNEGLLKAVRKFDPDQGVKFISYAVWWVRQAVLKAIAEQTRSVRVPLNQTTAVIRAGRAHAILAQRLGRDPTDDALGERIAREHLAHALRYHLTPRERRILVLYYGLEPGTEEMTLEHIGAVMGVTRERIRQIRERAFAKLRECADGRALSGYWRAA